MFMIMVPVIVPVGVLVLERSMMVNMRVAFHGHQSDARDEESR